MKIETYLVLSVAIVSVLVGWYLISGELKENRRHDRASIAGSLLISIMTGWIIGGLFNLMTIGILSGNDYTVISERWEDVHNMYLGESEEERLICITESGRKSIYIPEIKYTDIEQPRIHFEERRFKFIDLGTYKTLYLPMEYKEPEK